MTANAETISWLFLMLETRFCSKPPFTRTPDFIIALKRVWAEELELAGITTKEQLNQGLRKIVDRCITFFPDIGEFIQLCKPDADDLGIPDPDKAYKEAAKNAHPSVSDPKWSHPVVRQAYLAIGSYRLSNERVETSRRDFLRAYKACMTEFVETARLLRFSNEQKRL